MSYEKQYGVFDIVRIETERYDNTCVFYDAVFLDIVKKRLFFFNRLFSKRTVAEKVNFASKKHENAPITTILSRQTIDFFARICYTLKV